MLNGGGDRVGKGARRADVRRATRSPASGSATSLKGRRSTAAPVLVLVLVLALPDSACTRRVDYYSLASGVGDRVRS